jgi:hypothetical protein
MSSSWSGDSWKEAPWAALVYSETGRGPVETKTQVLAQVLGHPVRTIGSLSQVDTRTQSAAMVANLRQNKRSGRLHHHPERF